MCFMVLNVNLDLTGQKQGISGNISFFDIVEVYNGNRAKVKLCTTSNNTSREDRVSKTSKGLTSMTFLGSIEQHTQCPPIHLLMCSRIKVDDESVSPDPSLRWDITCRPGSDDRILMVSRRPLLLQSLCKPRLKLVVSKANKPTNPDVR